MPNSYVTFTGNGVNKTFSFAGIDDYLSTGYIKVYLDNTLVDPANYDIIVSGGNENVVFKTAYPAPSSGVTVKLARETPNTSAGFAANVVDFSDGSILTAADLDKGFKGMLHIVQEANDTGSGALGKSADGLSWNAQNLRLTNLSVGVEDSDAVTKSQLDAAQIFGSAITVPQAWSFTGVLNQTVFTLSPAPNSTDPNMFIVEVGGVLQRPNSTPADYTISATAITFNTAPSVGTSIQVRNFGVARSALDAFPNSSVTTQYLADGAVTEAKLASNSVTAAKLADNSVDTAAIQNSAVTSDKMAASSVATASLQNLAVTTDKISNNAVTTDKLGSLAVLTANIGTASVDGSKIANNAISYTQMNRGTGASAFTSGGNTRYLQVSSSGVLGLADISTIPIGVPAADVSFSSTTGSDGYKITNLKTPANAYDGVNKTYVDGLRIGQTAIIICQNNSVVFQAAGTVTNNFTCTGLLGTLTSATGTWNGVATGSGGSWNQITIGTSGSTLGATGGGLGAATNNFSAIVTRTA
jgi:hypothetical protein